MVTTSASANSTAPSGIKRILIAVDSSSVAARAAAYIRYMTVPGVEVRIVSVAENPRVLVPLGSRTDAELQTARAELLRDASTAVERVKEIFVQVNVNVDVRVLELSRTGGDTANALIDAASEWQADLLVVGARQHHGLLRWVEGKVSEFVTTRAACSILVVPANYEAEIHAFPRRILFALDGSRFSLDALRFGLLFAAPESSLRAVYVIDRAVRLTDFVPIHVLEDSFKEEGENTLAAAAGVFANLPNHVESGLVKTKVSNDDVPHAIVREARRWHADLLVVGTHGRRGLARWLIGSVAERTARITHTPLLLARPRPNSSS
ncbi:universal stress protein [Paraburkholderia sp. MMS20-SJTN17]|uniref:Universal stress protein n=1 Tax=Paraburkholderia translucens TaxID=2886945 RepID=A0ABS8KC81_9BURK|nr:universal stress protein [Paraburkholderia sp. MMS20-SJTN17]MCC8402375.1 universal stress protein [Paraburkholderia sp. MMS20-SJTN17]